MGNDNHYTTSAAGCSRRRGTPTLKNKRRALSAKKGDVIPNGTRTHNLTLRRGAPYPLGHGGIKKSCCAHRTALYCIPDFQKQKTYAWSGVRTHADKRPADLKSAPLDPSGIQARNTRRPQVNEPKARAEP